MRARVERLGEAAILTLLAARPAHGYELLERLPPLLGEERVDVGNLYRVLRALEDDGVVTSEWHAELPGPARRTYTITESGRALLAAWQAALRELRVELDRLDATGGGDHVRTETRAARLAGAQP